MQNKPTNKKEKMNAKYGTFRIGAKDFWVTELDGISAVKMRFMFRDKETAWNALRIVVS